MLDKIKSKYKNDSNHRGQKNNFDGFMFNAKEERSKKINREHFPSRKLKTLTLLR